MSLVTLSFTYQTTGISQIEDIKKALQGKVYNLLPVWWFFPPGFV